MTGYRVTMWRSSAGDLWEQVPHSGAWSTDGAADVYDTVDALREAEGPLVAVDVNNVEALLEWAAGLGKKLGVVCDVLTATQQQRDVYYAQVQRLAGEIVGRDGLTAADGEEQR